MLKFLFVPICILFLFSCKQEQQTHQNNKIENVTPKPERQEDESQKFSDSENLESTNQDEKIITEVELGNSCEEILNNISKLVDALNQLKSAEAKAKLAEANNNAQLNKCIQEDLELQKKYYEILGKISL